ncbi:MAG: hypothetical protein Q7U74_13225, partial [Saprospiraceae bacterium]|nr:hypothetical protein [Saprospiraceae bacterium]
ATPEEILPDDPGEVVPDQPELPTDETVPAETGGIFGIPAAIILGSLGIPVAGAVAGAALATILSLIGAHPVPGIAASGDVLKELEKNQQRETPQQDLRTFDMRLGDFKKDLYALRDELEKTNYVLNPWQGDPTILIHKGITLTNMAYDATIGQFTGKQGLTCQDYVQKTSNKVNDYLQKHFPGATVESMVFEERSSQADAKGFMNWLDSGIDDNHNLLRVKLPDGSELAVDFHQDKAGKAPLIRKWDEARKAWCDYLGKKEFMERTSYTLRGK